MSVRILMYPTRKNPPKFKKINVPVVIQVKYFNVPSAHIFRIDIFFLSNVQQAEIK